MLNKLVYLIDTDAVGRLVLRHLTQDEALSRYHSPQDGQHRISDARVQTLWG